MLYKALKSLENLVQRLLGLFGLKITSLNYYIPPIVTIYPSLDIRSLSYLLVNRKILVKLKLSEGRGLPMFKWGHGSLHPFAVAVRHASIKGNYNSDLQLEIYKTLRMYYDTVKLTNLACLLQSHQENSQYNQYPAWSIVMPWEAINIDGWMKCVEESVSRENKESGHNISIEDGWAWLGPVTDVKCNIEAKRLSTLMRLISKWGYQRSDGVDGDIVADILVDEKNQWVWQSIAGQHRAAVLTGLGYEECYIRIRSVVRREDVIFWPNVVNGFYKQDEALEIFDCVFLGNFPNITDGWETYLKAKES